MVHFRPLLLLFFLSSFPGAGFSKFSLSENRFSLKEAFQTQILGSFGGKELNRERERSASKRKKEACCFRSSNIIYFLYGKYVYTLCGKISTKVSSFHAFEWSRWVDWHVVKKGEKGKTRHKNSIIHRRYTVHFFFLSFSEVDSTAILWFQRTRRE